MAKPKPQPVQWRDRFVEVKLMRAGDVAPHPNNPRLHPAAQLDPLRGLLEEVGKADTLKAYYSERNGGKLTYWDGHGRRELDPNEQWRVAIFDLTDDDVDLLLVAHDEIASLATKDAKLQRELLAELEAENQSLDALLDQLRLDVEDAGEEKDSKADNGVRRLTGGKNQTVKAVIVAKQAAVIESALMSTGLRNRGEALTEVCREYLLAKGQLDIFEQEEFEDAAAS